MNETASPAGATENGGSIPRECDPHPLRTLKGCRHDLASPDWLTRERAARRLSSGVLEGRGVTKLLVGATRDPEGEVRKAAVESLGKLRPTKLRIQALLEALRDVEWEVRWAAVRSLESPRIRTKTVRQALEQAAADSDPAVAQAARQAIGSAASLPPSRSTTLPEGQSE